MVFGIRGEGVGGIGRRPDRVVDQPPSTLREDSTMRLSFAENRREINRRREDNELNHTNLRAASERASDRATLYALLLNAFELRSEPFERTLFFVGAEERVVGAAPRRGVGRLVGFSLGAFRRGVLRGRGVGCLWGWGVPLSSP